MIQKKSGFINTGNNLEDGGVEELLFPSIFLGEELHPGSYPATLNFLSANLERDRADKEVGIKSLGPGHFIFMHQYAGLACDQVMLSGVFLPLRSCDRAEIRDALLSCITRLAPPAVSGFPQPKNLETWVDALRAIGPLQISDKSNDAQEALMRLSLTGETFSWLRAHFQYITEISGPSNADISQKIRQLSGLEIDSSQYYAEFPKLQALPGDVGKKVGDVIVESVQARKITGMADLPWKNIDEFAAWLGQSKGVQAAGDKNIHCALLWENSD